MRSCLDKLFYMFCHNSRSDLFIRNFFELFSVSFLISMQALGRLSICLALESNDVKSTLISAV